MSDPWDKPRTTDERATALGCSPELVPVIERLDVIIALLQRMPLRYSHHPVASADSVLRELFPDSIYKLPSS